MPSWTLLLNRLLRSALWRAEFYSIISKVLNHPNSFVWPPSLLQKMALFLVNYGGTNMPPISFIERNFLKGSHFPLFSLFGRFVPHPLFKKCQQVPLSRVLIDRKFLRFLQHFTPFCYQIGPSPSFFTSQKGANSGPSSLSCSPDRCEKWRLAAFFR